MIYSLSFVVLYLFWLLLLLSASANDIFQFSVRDADGQEIALSKYRNSKVLLIVNVASNCGYTYTNYNQLKDLYDKYHTRGLEILAFPSNQFGDQEPGNNAQIQQFCRNYGLNFPVFAKIDVNGPSADPVYKFLKTFSDNTELAWNFVKFVVVNGYPVKRYASKVNPRSIESDLLPYLDPAPTEEL